MVFPFSVCPTRDNSIEGISMLFILVPVKITSTLFSDPPNPPKIVGYEEGSPIKSGEFQRFTCVAMGGNPFATLRWFKRDREVTCKLSYLLLMQSMCRELLFYWYSTGLWIFFFFISVYLNRLFKKRHIII